MLWPNPKITQHPFLSNFTLIRFTRLEFFDTMDKRGTAQGIIRVQKRNDKKHIKHLKSEPKNEGSESFEIDRNEFPSLNEISDRIGNHGKNPLESNRSFSYSEKLKRASTESRSCLKFEAMHDVSKNSSAFVRELSSAKNKTPFKNSMPRSLKMKSDNTDSEVPIEVSQSSGWVSNQEHSGTSKTKSPDKYHGINNSERNIPLTDPETNVRATNDGRPLNARNEISFSENWRKANSQVNRKAKSVMPDRTHNVINSQSFVSRTGNIRTVENFQNAAPSTSKTKSDGNVPSFQSGICRNERNSSKLQSNNKEAKPEQVDLHLIEVKKKKKRKSKIKRHAALQTGKISVLTPEAHSRILNQSNVTISKQNKNIVVNINDSEEYPELGTTSVPKNNKENSVRKVEITTKDTSALSDKNELEIVKLGSNLVASQPISMIEETLEAAVVKEEEETNAKHSDSEKTPVLIKDPITVSLFDMLLTAKSRKKEIEKKNESAIQESPLKSVKPLSRVLGKKGVSYAVNPLDSSRPAVKRGKEREKPKVKKPSRMRKLILMGRQLRKEEMTSYDENEKTDVVYTSHSDDCQSPSKLIDSVKDACNQNFTCHNGNILLSENEDFDSKVSSEENNSGISFSNEECQDVPMEQSKSTNYSEILSNDCGAETFSAIETKSSHIFSTNYPEKELKKIESSDKESLHTTSHESCSSEELVLSHFKEFGELASLRTLKSHNGISDEVKCILDNILVYTKNENQDFDFEMRKNENSAFVEEKCIVNSQLNREDYRVLDNCNLSTYQSFSEDNVSDDDESSKLEENLSISILNTVEKRNVTDDFIFEVSSSLEIEVSTSSPSVNDKDTSSFAANALNSEVSLGSVGESQKKEGNSLKLDLNENASYFGNLSKQIANDVFGGAISDEDKTEAVKTMIHSRKFRKYCNHFISKEIDKVVFALLDDLARFQDRMHQKDPVKARIRKRLLYGIKEIKRHMKLKKLKGIILATDIEDIKTEGGLNDVVNEIISLAEAYHIPYIFSHRRFNLGKVCRKGVPVSCVGIFNYEGSEKNFKRILELQEESKHDYLAVTKALDSVLSYTQITDVLKLGKGVPEKLYEMRAKILREHFKPDSNQSECEIDVPEVSMNNTDVDHSKDSNMAICKYSNLFTGTDTSAPKEMNKNEIYNILTKYNVV